jgi:chaperone required for assembly of F1-ATPase
MKKFWKDVAAEPEGEGWTIKLDGRPVRTPARAELVVPSEALAEGIAGEWRSVEGAVDPRKMPLTGIANAAIDRVVPDRQDFALGIARYAEADLACYRAQGPRELCERQSQEWDKLLEWARRRYDVDFATTCELMHVPQPAATIERLTQALVALGPFHLSGLSPLVTIGGSLLAALAVLERQVSPEAAWDAVSIDERWQIERWGADAEAEALLESRRRDFLAAARFLELLD